MKSLLSAIVLCFLPWPGTATTVPMQLCIGGGDHLENPEVESVRTAEKAFAASLVPLGATSHETYVSWRLIEPEEGKFTFQLQDTVLEVDRAAGLKWVPFLIIGPAYSVPKWFFKSPRSVVYRCLAHDEDSHIESLWNPNIRERVSSALRAFGKQYAENSGLESVLLGITGNYGESIYPASDCDWTQLAHGPYHTHRGWWTGDRHAVADFRKRAQTRYSDISALNTDWGTTFTAFEEVAPRLNRRWPSVAARQFQAEWALEAMTEFSDFWMKEAKAALPKTDVYLVTGGHAPAWHGLDISAQVQRAAARGCGIRITNEANRFALNFAITRMVASACRHYGTFTSYEPAGPIEAWGIAGRVFNASSSGVRSLHWYAPNLLDSPDRTAKWEKCRPFALQREPVIDVAVFYPRRWMNVQEEEELGPMYEDFSALRNAFDYDFVDERMLRDMTESGKQPYKALIVREDFDDDPVSSSALSGYLARPGAPEKIEFKPREAHQGTDTEAFLRDLSRRVHPNDDFTSGIYFARLKDGSTLWLNQRDEPADLSKTHPRMVKQPTPIEPYGLAEVRKE